MYIYFIQYIQYIYVRIHVYVLNVLCELRAMYEVCMLVWVDVHLSVSGIGVNMYVHLSTFLASDDDGGSLVAKFLSLP